MKKKFKGALSLLLCMIMVVSVALPTAAQPAETESTSEAAVSVNTDNDFSRIVMSKVESEEDNNWLYGITDIKIESETAKVHYSAPDSSTLIVAVYSEAGRMLGYGTEAVDSSANDCTVSLSAIDFPKYYVIKGFIVDDGKSAVCKEYVNRESTLAYEKFLDLTVDDFDENYVLNFDEDPNNNFAVLSEGTTIAESTTGVNVLISYDENTDTYVISNPDDKVRDLRSGDTLYLKTGEGNADYIIATVKSISSDDNTVTIVSDEETVEGVFDCIKIDSSGGLSENNIKNAELGEALTLSEEAPQKVRAAKGVDIDSELSQSLETAVNYSIAEGGGNEISVGGKLSFSINMKARVYYDKKLFKEDYFEYSFSHEEKLEVKVSVSGKIAVDKDKVKINVANIVIVGTPLTASVNVFPILEFSVKGSFSVGCTSKFTQTYNPYDGERRVQEKNKEFDCDLKANLDVKIGFGIELKVKAVGILAVAISADAAVDISGEVDGAVKCLLDKYHYCDTCVEGAINFVAGAELTVGVEITKKLKWDLINARLLETTVKLCDFYISSLNGSCRVGFTLCPNKMYKVSFRVTYLNDSFAKVPLAGASISLNGGQTDTNGDGRFDGAITTTGSDGNAAGYYKEGDYSATISASGYSDKQVSFHVDGSTPRQEVIMNGESSGGGTGGGSAVGDIITFGSYPQSEVTKESDSATYSKLEAAAKNWISYGYYSGDGSYGSMKQGDWMEYADMDINGDGANDYRAVRFTQYRPRWTEEPCSSDISNQDANGYTINNIYYFKYEPLKWQVLDPTKGLVLSKSIIDSQAYSNTIYDNYGNGKGYTNDAAGEKYANDYATSSIRKWLNEDFYNTAFTSVQKQNILLTTLDNSACSTKYSNYDSVSTTDNVFLLSYSEAQNASYGFTDNTSSTETRKAVGTDYAKAQGLWVGLNKCSDWRLRSAGYDSYFASRVYHGGYVNDRTNVNETDHGVRPALRLSSLATNKSSSARAQSMRAPASEALSPNLQNTVYTATAQNAVPGELYMLYAFSNGTDLSSLEYVAQLRADSSEVKFRYIPRNLGDLNVVIVGKFGDSSVQEPVEPEYGVERLELIALPAKTEYDYLSSPVADLSGLRLKAVYSDGAEKEITDLQDIKASEVDTSKLGDQEITLTYEGVSIQITVTVVPRKFKLIWIVDGSQTELTAAEGSKITKPAAPELEGYDFKGWSPEVPETMPAQDMTFTAVFEVRKYNATLVVDGKLYQTIEYTHGQQSIDLPPVPEKEGYTGKWEDYALTAGGVTINAVYTVNSYTVKWVISGKETAESYDFGSNITKPADPELEGYDFMGWSPEVPDTMPAQDMTFTAAFELRKYNATLVVDGKLYQIIEYTHGQQTIDLPPVPEKEGYTGKWEDYTLTAGGVTINAVYTVNSYTVKWIVNGKETAESYDFGSKITKPADPELEGYDFKGWSPEVPETMPTQDMTFTAVFEPIKTKLSINTPSTTTVSYGFTLNLHANVTDLPEGARVVWSMDGSGFELIPSADGMTCGVKSVSKGSATITAKVIDKNGNAVKDANGNEITASQQLTSKAGFFQKLVAFFKKLFGSNMVIPSSLNKLVK